MNIDLVRQSLPQLLNGLLVTFELVLCSSVAGFLLATILTIAIRIKIRLIQAIAHSYIFFIRGTPLLVQIFIIYYGSGQFTGLHDSVLWEIFKQPFACAVIALAMNTGAYSAVLFDSAISSIPKFEIEAAKALGMSTMLILRKIIIPRAMHIVLPAYSNEITIILKSTALVYTITVTDLFAVINKLISQTYESSLLLLIAGSIYLILNLLILKGFRLLESKYSSI